MLLKWYTTLLIVYPHSYFRFAAFYLSAFPNTTAYMIPQGVLQGMQQLSCLDCIVTPPSQLKILHEPC